MLLIKMVGLCNFLRRWAMTAQACADKSYRDTSQHHPKRWGTSKSFPSSTRHLCPILTSWCMSEGYTIDLLRSPCMCVHKLRISREEDYCGAYVQLYHPTSGPYITRFRRGFSDFAFPDFGSLPAGSPGATHISVIQSQGNVREAGSKNIFPKI